MHIDSIGCETDWFIRINKIEKTIEYIEKLKPIITANKATSFQLCKYRKAKRRFYHRNRLFF